MKEQSTADLDLNMPQPKVLIVDDQEKNLVALETLLGRLEITVIRATSGNQALAMTLEHDFAVALVDVQMPGMDGFELAELLHGSKNTAHLPIVFVSAAYRGEVFQVKGVESGAIDFLEKPILPQLLLGKVRLFIELYQHRRRLYRCQPMLVSVRRCWPGVRTMRPCVPARPRV